MLLALIRRFESDAAAAVALREAFVRAVSRVTRRYPDEYFELGQRSEEAMEGLADRVLTSRARLPKGRFPFLGRTPFAAYA